MNLTKCQPNSKILSLALRNVMAVPKKACQNTGHDCEVKCGKAGKGGPVDPAVLAKLEEGFKRLSESDSKSLLKKYLTQEVFDKLKTKKTSFGSSLLDCVQSGMCFVLINNLAMMVRYLNYFSDELLFPMILVYVKKTLLG